MASPDPTPRLPGLESRAQTQVPPAHQGIQADYQQHDLSRNPSATVDSGTGVCAPHPQLHTQKPSPPEWLYWEMGPLRRPTVDGVSGGSPASVNLALPRLSQHVAEEFLTIAHGIDDFNNQNSTKVKVAKLITHPYFDPWIMDNDVALLLLQSPLNLSVSTAPICLSEVTDMRRWRNCWVTGYGTTDPFHKQAVSAKLMKVDLKLINWDKCLHAISLITKNMICAGTPEGGKDACQSDSGGPLVCQKKKKSIWYQLGIVSWGVGCGLKDKPGVYTKVSSYLLWINTETKLAGKPYMHERDSGYSLLLSSCATLFLYFVILLLSCCHLVLSRSKGCFTLWLSKMMSSNAKIQDQEVPEVEMAQKGAEAKEGARAGTADLV
ncbi:serine protease 52-like [Cynocephalus volans]|uniref:serine protease 52-like n=1 Tax=Cynocephalus volans TaxID=110931 RepID=UPI002FC86AF7